MNKLFLTLLAFGALQANAQKYFTKTAAISFDASTSSEKIAANNKATACLLDSKTGSIDFIVQIKSFVFASKLMQEHFNENYMESDQFPKANFKGSITNITKIDFTKDGAYDVEASGKLTIHGVTKDVKFKGRLVIKAGKVTIQCNPIINLEEYKIAIPNLVKDKVARDAKVSVMATLELMK